MSIAALVPAHNEQATLPATIACLQRQTVPPDYILVISDNSSDSTVEGARAAGVDVMETIDNTGRKAGALNQALARTIDGFGVFLVMDADTIIVDDWIENALAELDDPAVGACGAVFTADRDDTWLTRCQSLEWDRFAEEISSSGRTFVLSGTAGLIRAEALEDVHANLGRYYREENITEDFALTCDLLAAGWQLRSPEVCASITETMPTVGDLYRQRRRWYQGAMQTVTAHGLHRYMAVYWKQQVLIALSVIAFWSCWVITAVTTIASGFYWHPFWAVVGCVFWFERVYTARAHRFYAALMLPELVYAVILQGAFVASLAAHLTGRAPTWHHINRTETVAC